MALVAYAPWLIIVVVIIGIIAVVISSESKKHTVSTKNNDIQSCVPDVSITNNQSRISVNSDETVSTNLTGFKAELAKNTKTTLQVKNEELNAEKEEIRTQAQYDCKKNKGRLNE